jgi:hypothetical protein
MSETRYCLVLTALERASSRVMLRSDRARIGQRARHRLYETIPIRPERIDYALTSAWALCPMLAARYNLDVDPSRWAALLDSYARALIMACEPHTSRNLTPHLAPLAADSEAVRRFVETVGA